MSNKIYILYIVLLVNLLSMGSTYCQLIIDTGEDTTLCRLSDSIMIGGTPTASGGIEPYKYEWTGYSSSTGQNYPTRFFLSDSSVSNPIMSNNLREWPPQSDILIVQLRVTDSAGISEIDSIQVGLSAISMQTALGCWFNVNAGDSVKVRVCNEFYGLAPFTYHWTPEEIFSDPQLQNPYAKPDTTSIIHVELTDALGCSNGEDYTIYVTPVGMNTRLDNHLNSLVVPNPINEQSTIILKNLTYPTLQIKIYDSQARLIVNNYFFNNSFKVGELIHKSGVYFYIISEESRVISVGKFIKN